MGTVNVVVHGQVHVVDTSKHPGGELVLAASDIDGTVLYESHHPREGPLKSEFYRELVARLGDDLDRPSDTYLMMIKSAVLGAALMYAFWNHACGSVLGTLVCTQLAYMFAASVMHDAGHGAGPRWWSRACLLFASCYGIAGTPRWVYKHLRHHALTNQPGDPELIVHPWLRLSKRDPFMPVHRWNPYVALMLYSLLHLDVFWDHLQPQPRVVRGTPVHGHERAANGWLYVFAFVAIHVGLPIMCGGGLRALLMELLLMCPASLFVSLLFQVSHVHVGSADEVGSERDTESDWAVHQVMNTCDFSASNPFITHLYGGLNYQIEHHLFPRVPHVALPRISRVLKSLCLERGIPYVSYDSFAGAVSSHMRVLTQCSVPS